MRRKILLVSQVYAPDPAAVARIISDAGRELAARGNEVVALTSDRGYDDPSVRYPSRSLSDGVDIRRLSFCSFGKGSMALRVLGGLSFTLQATFRALTIGRLDTLVVSTSPPMASLCAVIVGALRKVRVVYWPMDLNPDQALSLGLASERSLSVRLLEWLNRAVLRRADTVITLDGAMARRLEKKWPIADKVAIVPPWPEEDRPEPVPHDANPFRQQHGLEGKTVIMYRGTLGPSNPVETILEAAVRFENDPRVVFLFVGGGTGMAEVKARNRPNVHCLPYEPFERMRFSLSAGDVHIVSLGDAMVGVVHPCKVYGAMAISRPILYLGPPDSHVAELMSESAVGWQVRHGDVEGAVQVIRQILATSAVELERMGRRARDVIERGRSREISCGRVCDAIEDVGGSAANGSVRARASLATDDLIATDGSRQPTPSIDSHGGSPATSHARVPIESDRR